MKKCKECGGTSHLLKPHKESCSQYKHYVDDSPYSDCMNGRCKHCNPEYIANYAISFTIEERKQLTKALEFHLDFCNHEPFDAYALANCLEKIKLA